MALGGGTFISQNKVLPGAYINFVSVANANAALSDRGIATIAMELDWGAEDEVITVTSEDFIKNTIKLFGVPYTDDSMKELRDMFRNIHTLHIYRLNGLGGEKATSSIGTAKYAGNGGNNIKVDIAPTVGGDDVTITTYMGDVIVDVQTSTSGIENDFVKITSTSTGIYTFSGGTNGATNPGKHQRYLELIESYSYNTMGCTDSDDTTKELYIAFIKRMREELGIKAQLVVYNKAADYEGVVNVKNSASLVYWVTGAIAGCAVNKSLQNRIYDGEYEVTANYTQTQLANSIKAGEFVFHKVGATYRVLEDINSLVTTTSEKGDAFKDNMTIRIIDQVANDMAVMFNDKFIGKIANDASGRISLWNNIVKHHKELERIGAIENFNPDDVVVTQGDTKKAVVVTDVITPINAMAQLYMTVMIA